MSGVRPSINCFKHSNLHLGDCRWAVRRTPYRVLEYSIRCSTEYSSCKKLDSPSPIGNCVFHILAKAIKYSKAPIWRFVVVVGGLLTVTVEMRCCLKCQSGVGRKYFRFPADQRRCLWLKYCRRYLPHFVVKANHRLCSVSIAKNSAVTYGPIRQTASGRDRPLCRQLH